MAHERGPVTHQFDQRLWVAQNRLRQPDRLPADVLVRIIQRREEKGLLQRAQPFEDAQRLETHLRQDGRRHEFFQRRGGGGIMPNEQLDVYSVAVGAVGRVERGGEVGR